MERRIAELEERLRQVGHVRHDISNPLMGLLGCAELLDDDPSLPDDARRKVKVIMEEGRRVKQAVTDLGKLRDD